MVYAFSKAAANLKTHENYLMSKILQMKCLLFGVILRLTACWFWTIELYTTNVSMASTLLTDDISPPLHSANSRLSNEPQPLTPASAANGDKLSTGLATVSSLLLLLFTPGVGSGFTSAATDDGNLDGV